MLMMLITFFLNDTFKTIYDKNLLKTISKKHAKYKKPWITNELVKLIRKKHRLYKKYCKDASESNKKLYRNMRNMVTKSLRKARNNFYVKKFYDNKRNLKNTWNIIKKLLGSKIKTLPNYMTIDGNIIEDHRSIANTFNDHFVNLGKKITHVT